MIIKKVGFSPISFINNLINIRYKTINIKAPYLFKQSISSCPEKKQLEEYKNENTDLTLKILEYLSKIQKDRLEIFLGNYVELVVHTIIGVEEGPSFLLCCVELWK